MARRPPRELQSVADQLARHLAQSGGVRTLELMGRLGLFGRPEGEEPAVPVEAGPRRVGIWVEQEGGPRGRFERRSTDPSRWADLATIPPKGRAKRVVLLGESVARGLFYDPQYNCAGVLEALLRRQAGEDVEVVDLASIGISADELAILAEEATQLEPDALVVFAGNNWHGRPLQNVELERRLALADTLRSGAGLAALRSAAEAFYRGLTHAFLEHLAGIRESYGSPLPLVFVLPEFNLLDWRDPLLREPPGLDRAGLEAWVAARELAAKAAEERRAEDAERHARAMLALDGGLSSAGHFLLADAALLRADVARARAHLEAARDAEIWWMPNPVPPRACAVTQQALRQHAARHGVDLVDLPRVFEAHLDGALPGRRLFHDYCHLSAEGIRVAMAATAERVGRLLFGAQASWQALVEEAPEPPARVVAEAHLLAAAHNEQWGQPREIVQHHCGEALTLAPDLAGPAAHVAEFLSRRASPFGCSAFHELDRGGERALLKFFSMFPPGLHQLFVDSLVAVASERLPGLAEEVERIRLEEHATPEVDLLAPWSASFTSAQADGMGGWGERLGFYRAYNRESRFLLVCEGPSPWRLEITHRVPAGAGAIRVLVNGVVVGEVDTSSSWCRSRLTIPASAVGRGVNEIRVRWPRSGADPLAHLGTMVEALEAGVPMPVYPSVGHLFALTASGIPAGSEAESRSPAP